MFLIKNHNFFYSCQNIADLYSIGIRR